MAGFQMQPQRGIRSGGQHRHQHVTGLIDPTTDKAAVRVLLYRCKPHIVQQLDREDRPRIRVGTQGIASIEVQVTTYDALLDAAYLFEEVFENPTRADSLRAQAQSLGTAIIDHFWTEDKGGYFVLGTDRDESGNVRQLKIRTSNMGHVLNSRLLQGDDPENVRMRTAVVKQILSPELLCRSGIRTLASDEIRFRPGAEAPAGVPLSSGAPSTSTMS